MSLKKDMDRFSKTYEGGGVVEPKPDEFMWDRCNSTINDQHRFGGELILNGGAVADSGRPVLVTTAKHVRDMTRGLADDDTVYVIIVCEDDHKSAVTLASNEGIQRAPL
jgi:hypothetical protein